MMKKTEIRKILLETMDLAEAAGAKLIRYQKKLSSLKVTHKQALGVATDADVAVEDYIMKSLRLAHPHMDVLAEENYYASFGNKKHAYKHYQEIPWCWVVDPLDGTNNFLSGMDYYAVCIGLVHFGKPMIGVVHQPITGETYYACRGLGAYKISKGKKPKRLKAEGKKLSNAMLATGFATEKGEVFDREFALFKNLMGKSRGIRRMGSAALDLCLVADGIFDGFWETGLAPWDVAASGLICEEAGVQVTDYKGREFHPFQETIIAARKPLYRELIKLV
tara:strand:+ start:8834 stop:9667 length:834 start_codon:yes stop_codon:yes gene_type:complete